MVGRTNCGGASKKITVTIHGAPKATVAVTGTATASVLLDAEGDGSVVLKEGEYNFQDPVSGYSVTLQKITESTNIYLWNTSKTMLYWYGREFKGLTGGWTNLGARSTPSYPIGGTATKNTNNLTLSSVSGKSCGFATVNLIMAQNAIHFCCKNNGSDYLYYGASTNKSELQNTRIATGYNSSTSIKTYSVSFSSKVKAYPSTFAYKTGGGTVYEVWMD